MKAVSSSIYETDVGSVPGQTTALASLFWPLVCTTNYDDLYIRAKLAVGHIPKVLGRSEAHCREVLEHLSFPASEVLWALQGFLPRRDEALDNAFEPDFLRIQLANEIVVGHAEYRKEAHRAAHFRRSFAELFRTRSLFFLGSGLGEPYFLSLFDEIVELMGPPAHPHFAIIQEDEVDIDFLQKQYHILCNTYPKGGHQKVEDFLRSFAAYVRDDRVRPSRWGFRLGSPQRVKRDDVVDQFTCVREALPLWSTLPADEVVAISCGRGRSDMVGTSEAGRGQPLESGDGARMLGLIDRRFEWESDWTVKWANIERAYGIVARDMDLSASSPRDQRSADAIRTAFKDFLVKMQEKGVQRVHVQLLSAGRSRVFQPWVSLAQMARAYGEIFHDFGEAFPRDLPVASVYLVDPGVIAMLQGGYFDLVPQLQGAPFSIIVETIDAFGGVQRRHEIVPADASVGVLSGPVKARQPLVTARPRPRSKFAPKRLEDVIDLTVREFGLVGGSTLFLDYRDYPT